MIKTLTCIECPMGCEITVEEENGAVKNVSGNFCPCGKKYAESEAICPKRVVTSTVRAESGEMVPVKTNKPVNKNEIFKVMDIIKRTRCRLPVQLGEVLVKNISGDADLIVSGNV